MSPDDGEVGSPDEMRRAIGDRVADEADAVAELLLARVKETVTLRKTVVLVFAYALRTALDDLSPDEKSAFKQLIVRWL